MKNLQRAYKNRNPEERLPKSEKIRIEAGKYIFTVDKTLTIRSWNSDMEELCHRTALSVLGTKVDRYFPLLHDEILSVFAECKKRNIKNFRNNCFMGTNLCSDIQIIPDKKNKGEVTEVSVVFNNIKGECPLNRELVNSEKMVAIGKIASSRLNQIDGIHATIPEGAFYLFVDFNGHKENLNKIGFQTCSEFCEHLVHVEHTALLPGNSLLLPEDDFSVRLSFVDYKGDEVLKAWQQNQPITDQEKEEFFEKYCPLISQGIQNIERYFNQVGNVKLPVHV